MTVLLVVYPKCAYHEVATALFLLSPGKDLIVASPDGRSIRTEEGVRIEADSSYAAAPVARAAVVLVPGGDFFAVKDDAALDRLLLAAAGQPQTVVGGICNGGVLLLKAGVLAGRRGTHTAVAKHTPPELREMLTYVAPFASRSTYVDDDVVVDGRIVTAKPWACDAFAKAVLALRAP